MDPTQAFLDLHALQLKRERLINELQALENQRNEMAENILRHFDYSHSDCWLTVQDNLIVRVDSDGDVKHVFQRIEFGFLGNAENAAKQDVLEDPDVNYS